MIFYSNYNAEKIIPVIISNMLHINYSLKISRMCLMKNLHQKKYQLLFPTKPNFKKYQPTRHLQ